MHEQVTKEFVYRKCPNNSAPFGYVRKVQIFCNYKTMMCMPIRDLELNRILLTCILLLSTSSCAISGSDAMRQFVMDIQDCYNVIEEQRQLVNHMKRKSLKYL